MATEQMDAAQVKALMAGQHVPRQVAKPTHRRGHGVKAKGRKRKQPGEMNGVEKRMYAELTKDRDEGRIAEFAYESHKLRLADRTWLTVDFWVLHNDGTIEFRETKAAWRDKKTKQFKPRIEEDAAVKLKVAAEIYPYYRFTVYADVKGQDWIVRELP